MRFTVRSVIARHQNRNQNATYVIKIILNSFTITAMMIPGLLQGMKTK